MKKPVITTKFKRDYKLAQKRGKDLSKIQHIMRELANENPLPPANRDHGLTGDYTGLRECHIEPDWLLVYELTEEEIYFMRTGSHSDLFD